MRQHLEVDKARRTDTHSIRSRRSVGDYVDTKLAAWAFDRCIAFTHRHLEAFGEDLEVVDERFHRLIDSGPRRWRDLLVLNSVVAIGHLLDALAHDLYRLFDLGQANCEAIEAIPILAHGYVELDLVIGKVRHISAQVPAAAGRAKKRAGGAERQALGFVQHSNALEAIAPQRLAAHQDVILLEPRLDHVHQFDEIFLPTIVKIGGNSARTDVVVVHPKAGHFFEEAQNRLALAPAIDDHRHSAEVESVGRHEQQVRAHAVELGHQHADPCGTLGDFESEQVLGGERKGELGEQRRGIVHPGDVRASLEVGELLAGLFHAGMQIANDGL